MKLVKAVGADPQVLAAEKLTDSGLDASDAERLGILTLTGAQTAELFPGKPYPTLFFPYHDPSGNYIMEHGVIYHRVRFLVDLPPPPEDKIAKSLGTKQKKKKSQPKYLQPAGTRIYPYFPPGTDWPAILADPSCSILITEGELKAAKACKEGFPTIGLGGVYSWRAIDRGQPVLPMLSSKTIQWARRRVIICFDSDPGSKPETIANVAAAVNALAEELEDMGAHVHMIILPPIPGRDKVGLDDFLTHAEGNPVERLLELLRAATPIGLSRPLWELNDKYVYVEDPGMIYTRVTRKTSRADALAAHMETTRYYQAKQDKTGDLVYTKVPAAPVWLKWPLRTSAIRMTYRPGEEEFVDGEVNIWSGWGVEPAAGDHSGFVKLIDHLFEGAEPGAKEWALCWLAYPLQYPGAKLTTAMVLYGKGGTGKTLLGDTMRRIYGKNSPAPIGQKDITSAFNPWAVGSQFVMWDDLTGSDKYDVADEMKKMVTRTEIRVNQKNVPQYDIPDCINHYVTSNRDDCILLGDKERRYFIYETPDTPLPDDFYIAYGPKYIDEDTSDEGAAAVFHYLLQIDTSKFSPKVKAMNTRAKERMEEGSRTEAGAWCHKLRTNLEYVLNRAGMPAGQQLFSPQMIRDMFDDGRNRRDTPSSISREMRKSGYKQVMEEKQVRLSNGSFDRYFAVVDEEKWINAPEEEVREHLEKFVKPMTRKM